MNNVIQQAQRLILRGYGYSQLLAELNLTEEEFGLICLKDLVFKNEVEKRYNMTINSIIEEERKDVPKGESQNGRKNKGNTKQGNKRNKGDDTPSIA